MGMRHNNTIRNPFRERQRLAHHHKSGGSSMQRTLWTVVVGAVFVGLVVSSANFLGHFSVPRQNNKEVLYLRTTADGGHASELGTASIETNMGYTAAHVHDTLGTMAQQQDRGVDDVIVLGDAVTGDDDKSAQDNAFSVGDAILGQQEFAHAISGNQLDNGGEWNKPVDGQDEEKDVEDSVSEIVEGTDENRPDGRDWNGGMHSEVVMVDQNPSGEKGRDGLVDEGVQGLEEVASDKHNEEKAGVIPLLDNVEKVALHLQDNPTEAGESLVEPEGIALNTYDTATEEVKEAEAQLLLVHPLRSHNESGDMSSVTADTENHQLGVASDASVEEKVTEDVRVSEELSNEIQAESYAVKEDVSVEGEGNVDLKEVAVNSPSSNAAQGIEVESSTEQDGMSIDELENNVISEAEVAISVEQSVEIQTSSNNTATSAAVHKTADDSTTDAGSIESSPLDFDEKILQNTFMRSVKTDVVTTPGGESS